MDSSLQLKAGDVFIWTNYPIYLHTFKPRRWLLFLGYHSLEAVVYQVTTTTQYQHYESGGHRAGANFFEIAAGVGGLTKDSIVDLSTYFERIPEALLNSCKADIQKTGSLPQEYITILVKHIKDDKKIIPLIKKDIFRYLRDAGFTVSEE
jgi:hypothetical protein